MADTRPEMSDSWVAEQFDNIFLDPVRDDTRNMLEMVWFRNILYFLGEQWLAWFNETRAFGRRYTLGGNIPTPVSNIIRDYVRSEKALVLNKPYTSRCWPNSNERLDIEASELSLDVLRWMDSLNDFEIEDTKELIAMWMVLTGNGFARVFADIDDGVYIIGQDKAGFSIGQVACEPILPFSVVVPYLGGRLRNKAFMGLKSLKDKEWVEDMYGVKIQANEGDKQLVEYERQLLKLVNDVSPWKLRGPSNADLEDTRQELVLFREIEYRPTVRYPEGRYYAMAGSTVVKKRDRMPIPVDKNHGWDYSVVHFPYNFSPGGFWATGGVDDLISPQNTINEIDQSLAVNRDSLGRPFVLTPAQLTLRRKSLRGQGLLAVEYDSRQTGGAKPEIHGGTPMPEQVLRERDIQKQTAQDASANPKNILSGQAPTAKASGVMVDMLQESAESTHTPDIKRFYRNWGKVNRIRLNVAQVLFTEKRVLKVKGAGSGIKVRAFKGADLRGNTDVRIELDSALSSTQAGRNEIFMRLIETGFFNDKIVPRPLRREVSKRMGIGNIPDEENLHVDKAEKENSVFAYGTDEDIKYVALPSAPLTDDQGNPIMGDDQEPVTLFPKTYDPTFRFDNHAVHYKVVMEFMLSAEFPKLPEYRQAWTRAHADLHMAAMEAIEAQNTAKMAERAELGITEPGGGGAPPAQNQAGVAGPPGNMPAEMGMQGEGGGTQESMRSM
ncbi:MAG: hypothetical protein ABIH23_05095 [bacterium]